MKLAMHMTYKEDMAKTVEVMARQQGLSTTYEDLSVSDRSTSTEEKEESRRYRWTTRYKEEVSG